MQAFALPSFYDGQVRVNLAGREASGSVSLEHYDDILQSIEALLGECTDVVTGAPVVAEFVRSERKDKLALGPTEADLIILWNGIVSGFDHPRLGRMGPLVHRRPGGHTGGLGMAWFAGPGLHPATLASAARSTWFQRYSNYSDATPNDT